MNQTANTNTTLPAVMPPVETMSTFDFEGHQLRVIIRGGVGFFVARDLCRALDLDNVTNAIKALAPDEKTTVILDDEDFTLNSNKGERRGGRQRAVVTEGGMYTVVLRSRRAMDPDSVAYRFRRWVTDQVLPSIRRTGGYAVAAVAPIAAPVPFDQMAFLSNPDNMIEWCAHYAMRTKIAEAKVEAAQPAVDFVGALADSDDTWGLQAAGKALHQGPNRFVGWLKDRGDLFDLGEGPVPKQPLIDRKLFVIIWREFGGKQRPTTRLTGRGIVFYAKALGVRPPQVSPQALLPGF